MAHSTQHTAHGKLGKKVQAGQGRGTVRVLPAVLTCLSWVINGFIHLDEGACASPADQDFLLFICTEVLAIGDAQVDSAHLLAACRLRDLGHKRGATRLAGSRRGQDGIRAVLFSLLLLHHEASLFSVLL